MSHADYLVTLERRLPGRTTRVVSTVSLVVKATSDTEALRIAEEQMRGWEATMTAKKDQESK